MVLRNLNRGIIRDGQIIMNGLSAR